jgi:uncharacterized membrane protein
MILPVHILAGALAVLLGYTALFAAKGAALHRKSGTLFVVAMVALSLTGAFVAFVNGSSISVIAGLLTFYFVATALITVRPRMRQAREIDAALMLLAVTVAVLAFGTGWGISRSGSPAAAPMFVFGGVGLLAAIGDARVIGGGAIAGRRRIARHLWRMCFAMWVAAASFFWGPQGRVPEIIRIPALLPIPVLTPIVVMLYWLLRLRLKPSTARVIGGDGKPMTPFITESQRKAAMTAQS